MFVNPRETIMKVWKEGGMVGNGDFVPHFVAREVKKRYEWVTSPDVEERLRVRYVLCALGLGLASASVLVLQCCSLVVCVCVCLFHDRSQPIC